MPSVEQPAVAAGPTTEVAMGRTYKETGRSIAGAERELEWYWHEAEAELSMPSNYAWMTYLLGGKRGSDRLAFAKEQFETQLEAAERERVLRRRLARLDEYDYSVLRAVLGPWPCPKLKAYGEVTALAPYMLSACDLWESLGRPDDSLEAWTVRLGQSAAEGDRAAARRAAIIRREAERTYAEALAAYLEVRRAA